MTRPPTRASLKAAVAIALVPLQVWISCVRPQAAAPGNRRASSPSGRGSSPASRAYECLEKLQEVFYRRPPPWADNEGRRRLLEQAAAQIPAHDPTGRTLLLLGLAGGLADLERNPPPTRYENPVDYLLLRGTREEVIEAARALGLETTREPLFGTLPDPEMNARAIRCAGSDEHLVVVHSSLFNFLYTMTQLVLDPVEVESGGQVNFSSDLPPAIEVKLRKDLVELLRGFMAGYVALPPRGLRGDPAGVLRQSLVFVMVKAMELFIVGHEYAHVARGHTLREDRTLALPGAQSEGALRRARPAPRVPKVLVHSWQDEYEADLFGFRLMVLALERSLPAIFGSEDAQTLMGYARWAPLLFIQYGVMAKHARDLCGRKAAPAVGLVAETRFGTLTPQLTNEPVDDHPPAPTRRMLLAWALADAASIDPPGLRESRQRGEQLARALDGYLASLWRETAQDYWDECQARGTSR